MKLGGFDFYGWQGLVQVIEIKRFSMINYVQHTYRLCQILFRLLTL